MQRPAPKSKSIRGRFGPRSGGFARVPLLALFLLCAAGLLAAGPGSGPGSKPKPELSNQPATPQRLVSLNPSLSAIIVALDAADTLVGVDDYSARVLPVVADRPRVGGLFSPSLEAVVALQPDVVILVPSVEQRDFRERLAGLGVAVEVFDNIRFDEVLENIERLGTMLDRRERAAKRVAAINAARRRAAQVGVAGAGLSVVLVVQRDPLFIVGSSGFLSEMVDVLGARNLGDAFDDPYPRISVEWLVAQAPDVIIDMSAESGSASAESASAPTELRSVSAEPTSASAESASALAESTSAPAEPTAATRFWSRYESLPAVRAGRVVTVDAATLSMPGPYLDRSLVVLAGALYGNAAAERVAAGAKP